MSLRPAWLTFRRYAATTTGMTLVLFALGVYTAATGSGLACQAQWPLCSDQFIPEMTINPDFIEWFHRVWAMVTGFLIIGVAGWTWFGDRIAEPVWQRRSRSRSFRCRSRSARSPSPLGGLVPGGYTVSTHAAHLIVALAIFTLLGLATIWGGGRGSPRLLRAAIGVAAVGIVASAVFSRAVPFVTYSPGAQAGFYVTGLAGHLGLVAAIAYATEAVRTGYAGLDRSTAKTVRLLAAGSMAALVGTLLLGRDLVLYTAFWQRLNLVALGVAATLAIGAAWTVRGLGSGGTTADPVRGD